MTRAGGPDFVPPAERIAVFDNDGTLWCEKPMPIELGFILRGLGEMAEADETLRGCQPWRAGRERDCAWLGAVIAKHHHGDDTDVKVLMAGILQAFAGVSVEDSSAATDAFLCGETYPTLGRRFHACGSGTATSPGGGDRATRRGRRSAPTPPTATACCAPRNPAGGRREKSYDPAQPQFPVPRTVIKGGSCLCADEYSLRYRPAARPLRGSDR